MTTWSDRSELRPSILSRHTARPADLFVLCTHPQALGSWKSRQAPAQDLGHPGRRVLLRQRQRQHPRCHDDVAAAAAVRQAGAMPAAWVAIVAAAAVADESVADAGDYP